MKKTLLLLVSLFSTSLFAEKFENIEYQLPEVAKDWTVTRSENESAKMILYSTVPLQMFSVMSFPETCSNSTTPDAEEITNQIQSLMPNIKPDITILESDDHSSLYKLHLVDEAGTFSIVGWTRAFYSEKETTTLSYYATSDEDMNPIWMGVLREAKLCTTP